MCEGISSCIGAPNQDLGPQDCAENIPKGKGFKGHSYNSREWIDEATHDGYEATKHDGATTTILRDVFFGRLDLAWVEEFRVWPAKDFDAVMPSQPVAELRTDDGR